MLENKILIIFDISFSFLKLFVQRVYYVVVVSLNSALKARVQVTAILHKFYSKYYSIYFGVFEK